MSRCEQCGAEHERRSRWCSKKCGMRALNATPERKAYMRALNASPETKAADRARRATPEHKAYEKARNATPKRKAYEKARAATPERKAYERARAVSPERRAYFAGPEYKARKRARDSSPEAKARRKAYESSPEYRTWLKTYEATAARQARKLAACALRRARKLGVECERISLADIVERDQRRCGICHRRVDPELRYPHPKSASIDHIVPLAAGGAHTRANTQLAHLNCNRSKGARFEAIQMRIFG